jgi:hypothetical protein
MTSYIYTFSNTDRPERVNEEQMRRRCRFVIWTLAGEYNMNNYESFGLPFWKDLGAMAKKEDAYQRIVGVHLTPPA